MLQSHVITISGHFVGVAIRLDRGYRFVACDTRLYELDETIWPTLSDVERLARHLYLTGSFGAPLPAPIPLCEPASQVGG